MDLARVTLSDGSEARGARKRLHQHCSDELLLHYCQVAQTKEALILLEVQDPEKHPSGQGCQFLPKLVAANTESKLVPHTQIPGALRVQTLVTELVIDYGEAGSLANVIETRSKQVQLQGPTGNSTPFLPPLLVWHIVAGTAKALLHMHQAGWMHGDVKPENVVLDGSGRPMLVDFGLAHRLGLCVPWGGTPGYMAPEVTRAQAEQRPFLADGLVDVFAFGITMMKLVIPGAWAWEYVLEPAQLQQVTEDGTLISVLNSHRQPWNDSLIDIICLAIQPDRFYRASMTDVHQLIVRAQDKVVQAAALCGMLTAGLDNHLPRSALPPSVPDPVTPPPQDPAQYLSPMKGHPVPQCTPPLWTPAPDDKTKPEPNLQLAPFPQWALTQGTLPLLSTLKGACHSQELAAQAVATESDTELEARAVLKAPDALDSIPHGARSFTAAAGHCTSSLGPHSAVSPLIQAPQWVPASGAFGSTATSPAARVSLCRPDLPGPGGADYHVLQLHAEYQAGAVTSEMAATPLVPYGGTPRDALQATPQCHQSSGNISTTSARSLWGSSVPSGDYLGPMQKAKAPGRDLSVRPPASMEVGLQFAVDAMASELDIAVNRLLQAVHQK